MTDKLIDPDCKAGKCSSCVGGPCEHDCHQQQLPDDPVTPENAHAIEVRHMLQSYLDNDVPEDLAKTIMGERQAAYWNAYYQHMFEVHGCGRPFLDGSGVCGRSD